MAPSPTTASDPFAHARPDWSTALEPELSTSSSNGEGDKKRPFAATTAPVLRCYEEAVQTPIVECSNLDSLYSQVQLDGTDRFNARVLREDFCSTAIVATTWLAMDPQNRSQAVDIDYDALAHTQRRVGAGKARLLQSPGFAKQDGSSSSTTREITLESTADGTTTESAEAAAEGSGSSASALSDQTAGTWAPGAASDRFDRKLTKKREKEAKKLARQATASSSTASAAAGPRLTLLHSDVLDLPVPAPGANPSDGPSSALEPPDVVFAGNFAMFYFHKRSMLLAYLRMVLRTLRPKTGVFVTDLFGGPCDGERYPDQDETWARFQNEIGFGRNGGDGRNQVVLEADRRREATPRTSRSDQQGAKSNGEIQEHGRTQHPDPANADHSEDEDEEAYRPVEVTAPPKAEHVGTRAEWPRGKLKMVRTGAAHGGFEYWREDGPIDWVTNRFRMSLSFRFIQDGSWLRDVFWYDFRCWSMTELIEAMEEVGFVRLKAFALVDDKSTATSGSGSRDDDDEQLPLSPTLAEMELSDEADEGLEGMADLLRKTEKAERNKSFYRAIEPGEKLFASKSFGAYLVACAP